MQSFRPPFILLFLLSFTFAVQSCDKSSPSTTSSNPLLQKSSLPYQAPPFDKIEPADFKPAFSEGMERHLAEIEKITNNPDKPTFENTLVAMEKSGQLLTRVRHAFNILTSADTNPKLQEIQTFIAPKLAGHYDAIYLNSKLFNRVKTIYEKRESLNLDDESMRLITYYHNKFIRAGAALSDSAKAKLKELNEKEASLSTKFTNQLLAAAKEGALVVSDKSKLAGLSSAQIKNAAQVAKNRDLEDKWVIPLENTTQQSALQSLTNRSVRHELYEHSWNRAEQGDENDTRSTIKKLAEIRAEQAQLLGFESYAAWKLTNQMAKTPEAVFDFLNRLIPAATAKAQHEASNLQSLIDKQGGDFKLKPWDWNFYAEKLRKAKYDLDEDRVKQYFVLDNVLVNGIFYAANQLYGITFEERHDIPVWNKDVRVFELTDKNGSPLGLFYCDYFKRSNKSGGAWMSNFVTQSKLLGNKPVIYNVANFPEPAPGQPALLTFDQAITMFHEFGHALHGFFADQTYPSLSGTSVARDFVEFPSQFNEHWALYPSILKNYAKHYKTGETIPQSLVDKIKKASTFNQGYMLTELLEAAYLDMQWHTLAADAEIANVDSFEVTALKKGDLYLPQVPPRYRSSYFLHIWGNGYAAGYYAYLWTEMLAEDAVAWFENNGGLTRENGQRFREMILSQGNTEDYSEMYKAFTGHEPRIEPMLEARGIK